MAFCQNADAQLQQGDWLFDGNLCLSSSSSRLDSGTWKTTSGQLYVKLGRMMNEHLMLGSGLSYGSSNSNPPDNHPNQYHQSWYYGISPFARYYFGNHPKYKWFSELATQLYQTTSETGSIASGEMQKENTIKAAIGFGADYFIAPNLVFEAHLGSNVYNTDYDSPVRLFRNEELRLEIGLKTFLNYREKEQEFDIESRYLHKGNTFATIFGGFGMNGTKDHFSIGGNVNPTGSKFITDRVYIGTGVSYSGFFSKNNKIHTGRISGRAGIYLSISRRLYLMPALDVSINNTRYKAIFPQSPGGTPNWAGNSQKTIYWSLNAAPELSLVYFSLGSAIWRTGISYSIRKYRWKNDLGTPSSSSHLGSSLNLNAGTTYFIDRNIGLVGNIVYSFNKYQNLNASWSDGGKNFSFCLGVTYLIFKD